jgi:hypothetical protein
MTVHELLIRALNPNEIEMNFKCCKCEKNCENLKSLRKHIQTHLNNFQPFKCKICNNQLNKFSLFTKHSKHHMEPVTHKCITCEFNSIFDWEFVQNIKRHSRKKEATVKCPKCDLRMH